MKGLATEHHLEKAHGEQAPGDEEGDEQVLCFINLVHD
jgi:hypothetical protein